MTSEEPLFQGSRGGWAVAEFSMFAFSAGPFAARHETKRFSEKWPSGGASPLANAGKGWRKYTEDRNRDHVFLSEFSTTLEFSIVDELQSKKGGRLHPLHPRSKVLADKRFTLEEEPASANVWRPSRFTKQINASALGFCSRSDVQQLNWLVEGSARITNESRLGRPASELLHWRSPGRLMVRDSAGPR